MGLDLGKRVFEESLLKARLILLGVRPWQLFAMSVSSLPILLQYCSKAARPATNAVAKELPD